MSRGAQTCYVNMIFPSSWYNSLKVTVGVCCYRHALLKDLFQLFVPIRAPVIVRNELLRKGLEMA